MIWANNEACSTILLLIAHRGMWVCTTFILCRRDNFAANTHTLGACNILLACGVDRSTRSTSTEQQGSQSLDGNCVQSQSTKIVKWRRADILSTSNELKLKSIHWNDNWNWNDTIADHGNTADKRSAPIEQEQSGFFRFGLWRSHVPRQRNCHANRYYRWAKRKVCDALRLCTVGEQGMRLAWVFIGGIERARPWTSACGVHAKRKTEGENGCFSILADCSARDFVSSEEGNICHFVEVGDVQRLAHETSGVCVLQVSQGKRVKVRTVNSYL